MKRYFLESERLYFRKMSMDDFDILSSMLQDSEVMYAWEYTFEDFDVKDWITKNIRLYEQINLGYFLLVEKSSGDVVGQAALMPDTINSKTYYEIGYILKCDCWGAGFATEAAKALLNFAKLNYPDNDYILEIRPENLKSVCVAERLGARIIGSFNKNVRGKVMKHLIYKLD